MLARSFLFASIVIWMEACSFSHYVDLTNNSNSSVTVTYKLRPVDSNQQIPMFTDRPGVWRKQARTTDTTVTMNPADSLIKFTLSPGDRGDIGWCANCTMQRLVRKGARDAMDRMNLYWMCIEQGDKARTYAPHELLQLATKTRRKLTVLSIGAL